jgi:tRNA (cmo5U34)-methyltransferase
MTDKPFAGSHAQTYASGPPRQVPGFDGLHKMTSQLLAEHMPSDGHVLVVGAGGGLEINAFANFQPNWRFTGIDPSPDMLALAKEITATHASRLELREGYIDAAPLGPFDGATCILVMHFVAEAERLNTLRDIRSRLKPGAPFVIAHLSFAQTEPARTRWMQRHLTFGGAPAESLARGVEALSTKLTILAPEAEEALLAQAGFSDIELFYAGLSLRGWRATA